MTSSLKPIFILNAPPQTGKDTIAAAIQSKHDVGTCAMKDPMFKVFCATVGLDHAEFMKLYETPGWKDSPQEITNGKTPRELMIHISEKYVKPFFGEDYYGKALATHIQQHEAEYGTYAWVIPDGGFQGEYDAFKAIHGDRCVIIQLTREGHTHFGGDSRNWIYDWANGEAHFDTTNGNEEVINYMEYMIGG